MNLVRTFDAESEALSLTDVKGQLRITGTDEDDALRLFIAAIRHKAEHYLQRTLITSVWELKLDCFSDTRRIWPTSNQIILPMRPVQSISSVAYVDTDGASQTLSSSGYQFDRRGRLMPAYGTTWPSTRSQYDAVTVTYVCGETHAGNVPEDIKLAMLLWIGACDINREDIAFTQVVPIPGGAKDLLAPHKVVEL